MIWSGRLQRSGFDSNFKPNRSYDDDYDDDDGDDDDNDNDDDDNKKGRPLLHRRELGSTAHCSLSRWAASSTSLQRKKMHFYNQDTVQPFHFEKNLSPTAVLSLSATFSPTAFPSSSTMSMIIIAITISNRHNHTYHHPWTRWPFVCFVFCLARNNMNRAARYSPSNQCNVTLVSW